MATRKIFINWIAHTAQIAATSGSPLPDDFWKFFKYDQIPMEVVIVEPAFPYGPNDFARVDNTAFTLNVAVNDTFDDSTPLAANSSWTKDTTAGGYKFSGVLNLNTAAMNSYVGSGTVQPYLEFELVDAVSRSKIFQRIITIQPSVQPVTITVPDPIKEYYTKDEQMGIFCPRIMGPGETLTFTSLDGLTQLIKGVRNDGTEQSDYVNPT